MAVLFRIILLLVPVLALILWLRWRKRRKAGEELSDQDIKKARISLLVLIAALLLAGVGLRLTDTSSGVDGRYVPARVDENGNTIPGYFEPADKPEGSEEEPKDPQNP